MVSSQILFTVVALSVHTIGVSSQADYSDVCSNHSQDDELMFVAPADIESSNFPPTYQYTLGGNNLAAVCCATGFTHISWRVNGTIPVPNNEHYAFNLHDDDQVFYIYEMPSGTTYIECTVYSESGLSIYNRLKVTAEARTPSLPLHKPELIVEPPNECVKPGGNVSWGCQLQFDKPSTESERRIRLTFANNTQNALNGHPLIKYDKFVNVTVVDYQFYIHNISEDLLDMNYSCRAGLSGEPAAYFALENCRRRELETSYEFWAIKTLVISITVTLGAFIATLIVGTLVIIYNPEARVWWKKRIVSTCCIIGKQFDYDIFMIYGDDEYDKIKDVIAQLEKRYNLCLPTRDFEFGTAVAHETVQKLEASRVVIAVLSNSVFLQDCWTDSQIQMTMKVNRPIYFIKLENLSKDELDSRAILRAGLNVCPTIDFPSSRSKSEHMNRFYRRLYRVLPRSQNSDIVSVKLNDLDLAYQV